MLDMGVNGGGMLTVNFERDEFLSAQRPADVPLRDYVMVDDVVMIRLDPQISNIDLSAPTTQVARGTPQTDADGTRQATLLFSVRATEITVSERGPNAMPLPLPPTSKYTYAVELSVDEAIAAGAAEVRFNRAVPYYVENFLNFPVGLPVPVAILDRKRGVWVPQDNGRIIGIVSETAGLANIDIDGDKTADSPAALAALGITEAERAQLGNLYDPGTSLWRAPLVHFSPVDLNFPKIEPEDASDPMQNPPDENKPPVDDPCSASGSIIGCQNQMVGESIPIVGTPYALHYASNRVLGRREAYTLDIPLSATVPASLVRIDVKITIAGREFEDTFPAAPNQSMTFTWDGKDAYGRLLQGATPVTVVIKYIYPTSYAIPPDVTRSFGLTCADAADTGGVQSCIIPETALTDGRQESGREQRWNGTLGMQRAVAQGLSGWTLDIHHSYDPLGQVLHLGNGRTQSAEALAPILETATPADVRLRTPAGVAFGADGSIYVAERDGHRVRTCYQCAT
jgi:hypothetical protein